MWYRKNKESQVAIGQLVVLAESQFLFVCHVVIKHDDVFSGLEFRYF